MRDPPGTARLTSNKLHGLVRRTNETERHAKNTTVHGPHEEPYRIRAYPETDPGGPPRTIARDVSCGLATRTGSTAERGAPKGPGVPTESLSLILMDVRLIP